MKKKLIIIIISIVSFLLLLALGLVLYIKSGLSPVDKNAKENVEFIISSGTSTSNIIKELKSEGLIKNELALKVYARLHPGIPKAGRYIFTTAMSADEMYNAITMGKVTNDTVWITFVEGKRLTYIKSQISNNMGYSEEEIDAVLEDREYIKELIGKYNVLTDDILNDKIYHPLEGYLFPDTYEFNRDASIKEIIEKMIGTLDSKISAYANELEKSKYSIHEIMTLASIVELEGARSTDRKGISGVFYNRLASGWTLGSDVTTYYAVDKDFSRELTWADLNSCNAYNTRGTCVSGLPAGPIATPSMASITAAIEPTKHDYYYFVSDKNGKNYFARTASEHNSNISYIKSNGLWYTF